MIREWNPETWILGPIMEIRIDKSTYASKFSQFLSAKVFPHISPDNLWCSKISYVKNFRRGDLVVRRWNSLKNQSQWICQSTLEINRDSILIIVRDNSIKVREELTTEELLKYATNNFMEHLQKK